jgi:hypothetical protein
MTDDQPIPPAPQSQSDTNDDAAHPNSNAVPEVKIPPSHACYAIACKKKRDKWDIAKLVAEFAGLGFLILYTLFTAGIYCANKKVAEDTHQSVINAEASFKLGERAWVGVTTPITQNPVLNIKDRVFSFEKASIILRNSGKTPALKVDWTCCFNLEQASSDPIPDFDVVMAEQQRRLAMNPGTQIDKGNILYEGLESRKGGVVAPSGEEPAVLIKQRNEVPWPTVIYILGEMTYEDVFSTKRHTTKFCLQNSGTGFSFCREGNWMD